jgi:poly(A) polymerase
MDQISLFLSGHPFIQRCLSELLATEECYLVGGALRDRLLDRECSDYDLITPGDPTPLAKKFSEKINGCWFSLDSGRHHSRVVVKKPAGTLSFDFAPFRCPDLRDDLRDRDFTINALALPLHPSPTPLKICDPFSGEEDLKNGILRTCSEKSFENDPLRILRGVRLALQFGLRVEENSLQQMKAGSELLTCVAAERIKNELGTIFTLDETSNAIPLMEESGIIKQLWGNPTPKGSSQKGQTNLEKAQSFFYKLYNTEKHSFLKGHLDEVIEEGFTRKALIKFGIFMRGYDAEDWPAQLEMFRLSRKSSRFLLDIHRISGNRFHEWPTLNCGERGRGLWVESLGHHPFDLLIVLAILEAEDISNGLRFVLDASDIFQKQSEGGRLTDLIEPKALMEEGIEDTNLSKTLNAIRREEISGRVKSREEALTFVRELGTGQTLE